MLFNSWEFPVFLVIVWALYVSLSKRYQNGLLLVASYVFYGFWDWRFLALLFTSTIVDFNCARQMEKRHEHRRRYLLVSLVVNLGILGFFKYFNFFTDSAVRMLASFGLQADVPTLNIILPVGISFYTFQTLAYTIDVYRGKEKATHDPLSFAVYVAYFPQLVAGPIERSTHLLPQIQKERSVDAPQISSGLELILMGYFKKVFIADGIAPVVADCFANPDQYGGIGLVCGVYLFALQIYGDFSGYSDIARGVSRLFGIELRLNFKQPYLSCNITEFWRRWHMSLSSWLRDYLYISMGGNRKGSKRTYLNNMITMLLGGLWHGAAWRFIVWGGLHGLYLAVHKLVLREKKVGFSRPPGTVVEAVRWGAGVVFTFHLVCLSWVFFRAESVGRAFEYLRHVANFADGPFQMVFAYFLFFGLWTMLVDVLCWYRDSESPFLASWHPAVKSVVYSTMIVVIAYVGESNAEPFIYFQF